MDLAVAFLVNLLLAQISTGALLSLFIPVRRLLPCALTGVAASFALSIVLLCVYALGNDDAPQVLRPGADGQAGLGEGLIVIAMFSGAYAVFLGIMLWKLLKSRPD